MTKRFKKTDVLNGHKRNLGTSYQTQRLHVDKNCLRLAGADWGQGTLRDVYHKDHESH